MAPLLVVLLLGIFYLAVAGDRGGLDGGAGTLARRYWHSVDNKLPEIFGDKLIDHRRDLKPFLVSDWQSSDRPPLQTGMLMHAYPITIASGRPEAALALGVAANLMWMIALWASLRALRIDDRRIGHVLLATALVGAIFVNTVYTWPKLLAAALTLVVLAAAFDRISSVSSRTAIAAVAAALSLLAHGGALPGLIGVSIGIFACLRSLPIRRLCFCLLAGALIYTPWLAYQRFYDPPGDRLIKWHLGGVEQPTEQSPMKVVIDAYQLAGARRVVYYKILNLRLLAGDPSTWSEPERWPSSPGWDDSWIGRAREIQLTRLALAPGPLVLSALLLVTKRARHAYWARPLAITTVSGAVMYGLLQFGDSGMSQAWLHTAPYAMLLLWCAMAPLAVSEFSSRWVTVFVFCQILIFLAMWMLGMGFESAMGGRSGRVHFGMTILAASSLTGATLAIRRLPSNVSVTAGRPR